MVSTFSPLTYDSLPAATLGALPLAINPPPNPEALSTTAGSPNLAIPTATAVLLLSVFAGRIFQVSCV